MHLLKHPPDRDDRGATAVEYAIMVAMIALAIAVVVTAFGLIVHDLFIIPDGVFNGS